MIFNNNSKIPYFVYFIIYLFFNHLAFNVISIFGLWLIDAIKGCLDFNIWYHWWTDMGLYVLLGLLVFFPPVFFKIASNVKRIEVDEINKSLKIYYKPLLLKNRERIFDINDEKFEYYYQITKKNKSTLFRFFLLSNDTSLVILYEKKVFLTIRDTSGWTHQQIKEIVNLLDNFKNSMF